MLYDAHNQLMNALSDYSAGKANKLTFYDYCKKAESYFRKTSTNFNYGSSSDETTYLSGFKNFAISDQSVASNLMKYLDTSEVKYLSTAKENIKTASDAAAMIASNRAKLLKDAGYSSEEITKIIESISTELK